MLLSTRRNPPLTSGREERSSCLLEPHPVAIESSASLVVDIDEIVASPWIGLHYRHEFLLHHRHEYLEFEPKPEDRTSRNYNSAG